MIGVYKENSQDCCARDPTAGVVIAIVPSKIDVTSLHAEVVFWMLFVAIFPEIPNISESLIY